MHHRDNERPHVSSQSLMRHARNRRDPATIQELGQCESGYICTVKSKRVMVMNRRIGGAVLVRLVEDGERNDKRGPWFLQPDEPVTDVEPS